jgi:hypothetical protein
LQPQLWLDASDDTTITVSGTAVTQWNDKSGNGRNFTQGTAANRPINGAITQNGLNIIKFEANDFVSHGTASTWNFLHDGTQHIIAMVVRYGDVADPGQFAYVFWNNDTSTQIGFRLDYSSAGALTGRMTHSVSNGVLNSRPILNNTADGLFPGNDFHVFAVVARPGDAVAAQRSNFFTNFDTGNRNNTLTNTPSASNATLNTAVGASFNGVITYVAELIVVSGTNANEATALTLMRYLNNKWQVYP